MVRSADRLRMMIIVPPVVNSTPELQKERHNNVARITAKTPKALAPECTARESFLVDVVGERCCRDPRPAGGQAKIFTKDAEYKEHF